MDKSTKEYHLKYLTLKLTNNCNLKCKMCGQFRANHRYNREELDIEVIKKILCTTKEIEHVYLFGGEPLLYKQIVPLLNFLNEKQMPCRMTTNGVLLGQFAEEIINFNVRDVEISLDSHIKDSFEQIRGVGVFDKVVNGIENLLEERKKANKRYPKISINAVILPENYQELIEMAKWIKRKFPDIDAINFELPMNIYRELGSKQESYFKEHFNSEAQSWKWFENNEMIFSNNQINELFDIITELRESGSASIKGPSSLEGMIYSLGNNSNYIEKSCEYPFYTLSILPDGNATFCVDFPDYMIGNIYNMTMKEIWMGEKAETFRRCMEKTRSMPICERCTHRFEIIKKEKESFQI